MSDQYGPYDGLRQREAFDMDLLECNDPEKRQVHVMPEMPRSKPRQRSESSASASYHSRLSGQGICGISAYGLIILAVILVLAATAYGTLYGLAHIYTHYIWPS